MILFETLFALLYGFLWEQRWPTTLECVAFTLVVLSVVSCLGRACQGTCAADDRSGYFLLFSQCVTCSRSIGNVTEPFSSSTVWNSRMSKREPNVFLSLLAEREEFQARRCRRR